MIGTDCILGRASHTKETLPDFREWCRATRHPRVFRRLTGCQRGPPDLGHHSIRVVLSNTMTSRVSSHIELVTNYCNYDTLNFIRTI